MTTDVRIEVHGDCKMAEAWGDSIRDRNNMRGDIENLQKSKNNSYSWLYFVGFVAVLAIFASTFLSIISNVRADAQTNNQIFREELKEQRDTYNKDITDIKVSLAKIGAAVGVHKDTER